MFGLIRFGAYLISALSVWQFFQGDSISTHLSVGRHLALDATQGMLFGVCAGFSNFTGIDVSLIRLVWFIAMCYRGLGILFYILAFLIMPAAG